MRLFDPRALLLLAAAGTAAAEGRADATVTSTDGKPVRLGDLYRGKPAVLFYEDKSSTSLNQALKDELFRQGKEHGLLDAVAVVAVANVKAFDWFPASNFVVSAVKDTEKAVKVPVYLDWKGTLAKAPWSLDARGATVVLVDRKGEVQYSKTGQLTPAEVTALLARLDRLIAP